MRSALAGILLAATLSAAPAPADVDIGGVILTISDSWTAQVFHIVDQLSEWDAASHRQYGRWAARELKLDDEDRRLLREHAQLRRARGWGKGFEQAFYVDDSIDAAARNAARENLITPAEAEAEKAILLHFSLRLAVLRESGAPVIAAFRDRLAAEAQRVASTVRQLLRFSETKDAVRIPVFLAFNPENGNEGGGYNGNRLVLEVQTRPDPTPTLLHECLHALLRPHRDAIEAAAKSVGLTWGNLNEGIAYALAPGLTDRMEESDTLAEALIRNVLRGTPATDGYVQSYLVALAIRPLVRSALASGETVTAFLPKAAAKWREVAPK